MTPTRQFVYRLALALGVSDAEGLMRRMGSRQLEYWRAFYAHEPWGFEQDWLRAGTPAAAAYNASPYRGADAPVVRPDEFVPRRRPKVVAAALDVAALARRAGAAVRDFRAGAKRRG